MIGIVWFYLGLLWWTAILAGAVAVYFQLPKGRRLIGETGYFFGGGLLAWSTMLIPQFGVWIWMPIIVVAMSPFVLVREWLA